MNGIHGWRLGLAGRVATLAVLAGVFGGVGWQGLRGQGMPPALREGIHTLFDRHEAVTRTVRETDDGYVAVTESEDPAVAAVLQGHVAQMEARLKDGFGVRRWDPAFPEYQRHYRDMEVRVEPVAKGVRVTVVGRTPEAVKVARNHARVVSDFAAHGWEAHDRSHPGVLDGSGGGGLPGHAHGAASVADHPIAAKPEAKPAHDGKCDAAGGGCCHKGGGDGRCASTEAKSASPSE